MTAPILAAILLTALPSLLDAQPRKDPFLILPKMPERRLIRKVEPVYPQPAIRYRVQGTVRFTALIGKDGRVERLALISGHPLLAEAAVTAVKQWLFRPMRLEDVPMKVLTQLRVSFELDAHGKPRGVNVPPPEILL